MVVLIGLVSGIVSGPFTLPKDCRAVGALDVRPDFKPVGCCVLDIVGVYELPDTMPPSVNDVGFGVIREIETVELVSIVGISEEVFKAKSVLMGTFELVEATDSAEGEGVTATNTVGIAVGSGSVGAGES